MRAFSPISMKKFLIYRGASMFIEEKIYNEFVTKKIKEARENIADSRYITLEQAKTRMRATIQKASKRLNTFK